MESTRSFRRFTTLFCLALALGAQLPGAAGAQSSTVRETTRALSIEPKVFQPQIGVPGGPLKEVDVAHIGGSAGGPKLPLIVSAVGTGATVRLTSWQVLANPPAPKRLADSPNIVGYDVRLHVLTPDLSPELTYNLLVSAVRDPQENLWLTTWRLNDDGTFVQLGKRGYGSNVNVDVRAYALAHRPLLGRNRAIDRFQVVTPIRTATGTMRLISWSVNATTGAINGLQDSGNWGSPASDTTVDAATLTGDEQTGPYYVVSYRNTEGMLATNSWAVNAAGMPSALGSGASGLDIRGTSPNTTYVNDQAIAPLTATGFVSAHTNQSQSRVSSWENRAAACTALVCSFSPHFISDNSADLNPGFGIGLGLPMIASQRALLVDALGASDLASADMLFKKGDDTVQGVASIRKVMVLFIALEAIAAGEVALDDIVTVSQTSVVNHPGNEIGLELDEKQSLRTLIHGMMMVSGGDATQAIIEYIGAKAGGNADTFVQRMKNKATELQMNATLYCGTGGYCYSTTEDQVALWLAASQAPLFHEFAGNEEYDACGETTDGTEKCYSWDKNVSTVYPGVESHKTGGGGFDCLGETSDDPPRCASEGCLSIQATRLSRALVINELHPNTALTPPDRWNDARTLFDYGYRQLFTPDFRGAGSQPNVAMPDFAIDNIGDTQFVSAILTPAGALRLCNYQVVAGIGQISLLACADRKYTDLPGGAQVIPPTRLDILSLSTLESEGDYLSGQLENGTLNLRAWRVAE